MAKRKPTLKSLKSRADRIFSEYTRKKDCDENGWGRCCTCGKPLRWDDGDAGHYLSRRHSNTRFVEENCHLQCRSCNRGGERTINYTKFMLEKYGKKVIDSLAKLEVQTHTFTCEELLEIIEKYTNKLKGIV